jgi:hypothetical protein
MFMSIVLQILSADYRRSAGGKTEIGFPFRMDAEQISLPLPDSVKNLPRLLGKSTFPGHNSNWQGFVYPWPMLLCQGYDRISTKAAA